MNELIRLIKGANRPNNIERIDHLLLLLKHIKKCYPSNLFYRGQTAFYPIMTPSIFRTNKTGDLTYLSDKEYSLIQRLATEEPEIFQQDSTIFEKMVRAQHYGAPTRLLDVTTNPLVALYFACQERKIDGKAENGRFYIFHIEEDKIKFWNDPQVTLYSSLLHLNKDEQDTLLKLSFIPHELEELRAILKHNLLERSQDKRKTKIYIKDKKRNIMNKHLSGKKKYATLLKKKPHLSRKIFL